MPTKPRSPLVSRLLLSCVAALAVTAAHAAPDTAANSMPIVVKGISTATAHAFNRITASIRVCTPGSDTACVTVDNVILDTGSVGLRLQGRALAASSLPVVTTADNRPVAECFAFVGRSNIWGNVRRADVHLGGLVARNIPVQVSDRTLARPADNSCPDYNNDPASNATLGIGWAKLDRAGTYYECGASDCTRFANGTVPPEVRVPNPVSRLPVHDNGEVFEIPQARAAVTDQIAGTLFFGVGTAADNRLDPSVQIVPLDAQGNFTTWFDGNTYPESYFDSGTQTLGFLDPNLQTCMSYSGDYCVARPSNLYQARLSGTAAATPVSNFFRISRQPGPAGQLRNVYDDIASVGSAGSFVWGLPFFIEKRVFVVQQGETPQGSALAGPFYGFNLFERP